MSCSVSSPGLTERPHVDLEWPGRPLLSRRPPVGLGDVLRVHVLAALLRPRPHPAVYDGVEHVNTLRMRHIIIIADAHSA